MESLEFCLRFCAKKNWIALAFCKASQRRYDVDSAFSKIFVLFWIASGIALAKTV